MISCNLSHIPTDASDQRAETQSDAMNKLLRGLAFVCLVLGFVSAAQTASNGRYAVQAVVWFLLEFVLLWLNSRLDGLQDDPITKAK